MFSYVPLMHWEEVFVAWAVLRLLVPLTAQMKLSKRCCVHKEVLWQRCGPSYVNGSASYTFTYACRPVLIPFS